MFAARVASLPVHDIPLSITASQSH